MHLSGRGADELARGAAQRAIGERGAARGMGRRALPERMPIDDEPHPPFTALCSRSQEEASGERRGAPPGALNGAPPGAPPGAVNGAPNIAPDRAVNAALNRADNGPSPSRRPVPEHELEARAGGGEPQAARCLAHVGDGERPIHPLDDLELLAHGGAERDARIERPEPRRSLRWGGGGGEVGWE